ncbi:MAG: hypothetical protein FJ102_19975 [Deltaproteobacteria bacterium]|nr:hypothetical protein [Deltaproteobacteria bacterium]
MDPRPLVCRRGSSTVMMVLMLVVILGVAAVAIDGARLRGANQQLYNAAEAAAHSAAMALDGTTAGYALAETRAAQIVAENSVDGLPVSLVDHAGSPSAVELGQLVDGVFVADTSDPSKVKAVRVNLSMPGFGTTLANWAFGNASSTVGVQARALGGGPSDADCPLPIALPSCALPAGDDICNLDLVLGPDGNDNAAWARIGASSPNAAYVKSAIATCAAESSTVDVVSLNNGQIATAASELAKAISASPTTWSTSEWGTMPSQMSNSAVAAYGHVLHSQIIVFKDADNCADTKMTGSRYEIEGFATAVVYDARATGKAADRKIALRVVCDSLTANAGGGFFGTKAPPQFW